MSKSCPKPPDYRKDDSIYLRPHYDVRREEAKAARRTLVLGILIYGLLYTGWKWLSQ